MSIASEYWPQCSIMSIDSASQWNLSEGSLVGITWRLLASASAGAAHGSSSSGVDVGGGNSRLEAAAMMTARGPRKEARIATAVGACDGGNPLHHFAWRCQTIIVVKNNNIS